MLEDHHPIAYELSEAHRKEIFRVALMMVPEEQLQEQKNKALKSCYVGLSTLFALTLHLTGSEEEAKAFLVRNNLFVTVGLLADQSKNWTSYLLPVHPEKIDDCTNYTLGIVPDEKLTGRPLKHCTRVVLVGQCTGSEFSREPSMSEIYKGLLTRVGFQLNPIIDLRLPSNACFRIDLEKVTR